MNGQKYGGDVYARSQAVLRARARVYSASQLSLYAISLNRHF